MEIKGSDIVFKDGSDVAFYGTIDNDTITWTEGYSYYDDPWEYIGPASGISLDETTIDKGNSKDVIISFRASQDLTAFGYSRYDLLYSYYFTRE